MTTRSIARFIIIFIPQANPHFLMIQTGYRLTLALALSLTLHLAPLFGEIVFTPPPPGKPSAITAQLRPPPAAQIPLELPEPIAAQQSPPPRQAAKPSPTQPSPRSKAAGTWHDEVKRQLKKMDEQGLFYPQEAIAQGLEGEVLILAIIDENGRVGASRVEQGSGHRLLDDAALHAVRSLRALPASAPRETLLPVRFRLK